MFDVWFEKYYLNAAYIPHCNILHFTTFYIYFISFVCAFNLHILSATSTMKSNKEIFWFTCILILRLLIDIYFSADTILYVNSISIIVCAEIIFLDNCIRNLINMKQESSLMLNILQLFILSYDVSIILKNILVLDLVSVAWFIGFNRFANTVYIHFNIYIN